MKKHFCISEKDYFSLGLKLLGLLCSVLLTSGCIWDGPAKDPVVTEGIGIIAQEKSRAEGSASALKRYHKVDTQEYKKGEFLYIEAKAAFDGWIERLKFDLTARTDIEKSDEYKKSLDEAAAKSQKFVNHVQEISITTKGIAPIDIFGALIDGGIKIWKEWKGAREERRKEIIKQLDGLKLKSFDEIKGP